MIRKLLALPNDDTRKILFVAFSLCLVCSLIVSTAAVVLKPMQDANKAMDRKKNILEVAGLLSPGTDIDTRVPSPGRLSTARSPPIFRANSRA